MRRSALLITTALAIGLAFPGTTVARAPGRASITANLNPRVVATFPTGYELNSFAESLAIAPNGDMYATVTIWQANTSNIGKLYRITPGGKMTQVGPDLKVGILSGLAFDDRGYLYAGVIPYGPDDEPTGVLRFAPDGTVTRAVTLTEWGFPNGLAFHGGYLYIADSYNGAIWRARPSASSSETLTSPWLKDRSLAVQTEYGWEGVNGIAFNGNTLYAVNADTGSVVRISLARNGGPGTPGLFVQPNNDLVSADGIAFDEDGGLWIVVNHPSELVGGALARVDRAGHVAILASDPGWLDYPSQPAFGTKGRTRSTLYVLNGSYNTGNCNLVALSAGVRGTLLP